jgi:hypothetical protein
MKNRGVKATIYLVLGIAAVLFIQGVIMPSDAAAIVIKPGKLDHLVLEMPDGFVAGESFNVGVKAYDANNNLITNYDQAGRDIQVSVSGSASAVPSVLKASAFSAGSTSIRIEDTKAEDVRLVLYDTNIENPLMAVSLDIRPNKLDHFVVAAPSTVRAGERFSVRVTAEDRFGNTVTGVQKSNSLKVHSVGSTDIKDVVFPDFVAGSSVVTTVSDKTGTMYVELIEPDSAVKGRSADIEITPADLDHFAITVPSVAEAGRAFQSSIVAYDRFDNVVYGYAASGKGVEINSSGVAPVAPSYVSPGEFKKGSATVAMVYEKAENISLTVTEKGGAQAGKSARVTVKPSAPDHFAISTPEEATADDSFRLKIEAYDRFGNLIKEFSSLDRDVYLSTSGTGRLTPSVVSAGEFSDGIATVDVRYDKAESITITASLASGKAAAPMPEQKKMKAKPKRTPPPKVQAPPPAKEPEKKMAKRAPAKEMVKGRKVFGVSDVKLIEAGPRALVVIKVPGLSRDLKYEDTLQSIRGRDWIKLTLSPAENEIAGNLEFESDIIGQVKVSEDRRGTATEVMIELKPKRVQYSIKRDEGSVVVDVLRLGVAR